MRIRVIHMLAAIAFLGATPTAFAAKKRTPATRTKAPAATRKIAPLQIRVKSKVSRLQVQRAKKPIEVARYKHPKLGLVKLSCYGVKPVCTQTPAGSSSSASAMTAGGTLGGFGGSISIGWGGVGSVTVTTPWITVTVGSSDTNDAGSGSGSSGDSSSGDSSSGGSSSGDEGGTDTDRDNDE